MSFKLVPSLKNGILTIRVSGKIWGLEEYLSLIDQCKQVNNNYKAFFNLIDIRNVDFVESVLNQIESAKYLLENYNNNFDNVTAILPNEKFKLLAELGISILKNERIKILVVSSEDEANSFFNKFKF